MSGAILAAIVRATSMACHCLRIVHVVKQFQPSSGGLETYVKELATRQATKHDVTILTLNRIFGEQKRLPKVQRWRNLTVVRIPFIGYRRLFLPYIRPRELKGYDVVHVHGADQLLDIVAAISWVVSGRLFMTTHGLFFHTNAFSAAKNVYFRTITRWSLSRAKAVFAVSNNDSATLKKIGVESIVLRNPIVPLGHFLCEGKDLLYLGRLSANKRIHLLIAFMACLVKEDPSINLHIVGPDTEKLWPELSAAIVQLKLEKNICYHGFLDEDALVDVAKKCGFTVSAARYEGFGLAVIEGMSVGLLPLMHNNAAFEETFQLSECGLLTNFDDPPQAVRDFVDWFPRVQIRDRLQAVTFAHAQSWESAIRTYEKHYWEN